MSATVEVLSGPLAGRAFPVPVGGLSIGRDEASGLVLDDGTVSRRHARVTEEAGTGFLRDLGSRNGVTIGGHPVKEGRLDPGASFTVGRIACRFLAAAPAVPVAASAAPPAAAPSSSSPTPAGAAPPSSQRTDWRFLVFLGVSGVIVLTVLLAWYGRTRGGGGTCLEVLMKEGEERYVPVGPLTSPFEPVFRDPNALVEVLKLYPSAIAFRARAEGDAEIEFPQEGGKRTLLKVLVRGRKRETSSLEIPTEAATDKAKLQAFCERQLAGAKALAGDGHLLQALRAARGIEGQYRDVLPKPLVAVEARDQGDRWAKQREGKLDKLEEERKFLSDKRDCEGVERVLYQQRDLVEPDSAAHQRLKFLLEVNQRNKPKRKAP